jgi:hypothetical protein
MATGRSCLRRGEDDMAFTVEDLRDLLRLLEERPEWRAEVRRALLTDELLALPELVRALGEAQRRAEERLSRVEDHLAALAEAQRQSEAQLAALARTQRRTDARVDRISRDLAELKGDSLERRYRERAPAYVGRLVRRSRVLMAAEVMELLEPLVERGALSAGEADEVALADLILRGRRPQDNAEVYLVMEVSWTVGLPDVERVVQCAALLQRAGLVAVPVVAGTAVRPEAARRAQELHVWQLTDGQLVPPAA